MALSPGGQPPPNGLTAGIWPRPDLPGPFGTLIRDTRTAAAAARSRWLQPGVIGYALLWRDRYRRADGITELFHRHAFDGALRTRPVIVCRINHKPCLAVGNTADGSLQLRPDATGLRLELTPYDTAAGRLLIARARAGELRGASVGFDPKTAEIASRYGHRTVLRAVLTEVSIIVAPSTPAYRASWAALWTPAAQQRADAAQLEGYASELDDLEADL